MHANQQLQKPTFDVRVLDPTGKDIASSLQIQKVNEQYAS